MGLSNLVGRELIIKRKRRLKVEDDKIVLDGLFLRCLSVLKVF